MNAWFAMTTSISQAKPARFRAPAAVRSGAMPAVLTRVRAAGEWRFVRWRSSGFAVGSVVRRSDRGTCEASLATWVGSNDGFSRMPGGALALFRTGPMCCTPFRRNQNRTPPRRSSLLTRSPRSFGMRESTQRMTSRNSHDHEERR